MLRELPTVGSVVEGPAVHEAQDHLLRQMHLMLQSWRGPVLVGAQPPVLHPSSAAKELATVAAPQARTTDVEERVFLERALPHNVETCRTALAVYAAASGPFEAPLNRMCDFLLDVIDVLSPYYKSPTTLGAQPAPSPFGDAASQRLALRCGLTVTDRALLSGSGDSSSAASTSESRLASAAGDAEAEARCRHAYAKVDAVEAQLRRLTAEHDAYTTSTTASITELTARARLAEEQLEYQIRRMRRITDDSTYDREEFERERSIIESNRQLEREKATVAARDATIAGLQAKLTDLLALNGQYARQTVEIAARVRVYAEHNERLANCLNMQYEERTATMRENELLRTELLELNRFHQLRHNLEGTAEVVQQRLQLRGVIQGRGVNQTVPRHLQFSGLVNRIPLPRPAALALVSDILTQRQAARVTATSQLAALDLGGFTHAYFARKHGEHGVAWAYALDDATSFFDDCNLRLFGLTSRATLPEAAYDELSMDISMLLAACEALDRREHGGDTRLTVALGSFIGAVVAMYPGYSDAAIARIVERVRAQLASGAAANVHYRMLFPNLEREEFTTAAAAADAMPKPSELRDETSFSAGFKTLLLDDALQTTQLLEDAIWCGAGCGTSGAERLTVSWFDLAAMVQRVYDDSPSLTAEVMAQLRRRLLDAYGSASLDLRVAKWDLIATLRRTCLLRRAHRRGDNDVAKRIRAVALAISKEDGTLQQQAEAAAAIDFAEIFEHLSLKRREYLVEEAALIQQEAALVAVTGGLLLTPGGGDGSPARAAV